MTGILPQQKSILTGRIRVRMLFSVKMCFQTPTWELIPHGGPVLCNVAADHGDLAAPHPLPHQAADGRSGEFVLVRSGERVPLDGVVIRGEGTVDESIITGDSEPVVVRKDAHVLAGSLYTGSLLLMRTMVRFDDSAISRIMRVQEDGGEHKAALENSMIRMVSRFIPFMFILAVLLAIVPPLLNSTAPIQSWVYRALTLLAVSCPAALAVSVPLVFWCGSNRLSRRGVHVKGSEAIEKTAEMRMAVFNKTGTLTQGVFEVSGVHHNEMEDKKLLEYDDVDLAQMSLFDTVKDDDVLKELKELDLGNLTPIEALNTLYQLQNKLKNRW